MEGDLNSKVTIECTDPSNVFAAFEPLFHDRLPLRNLHWKSPTRPLRSINVLNVALSKSTKQDHSAHGNVRRHQIPGLRQTPYVKIYLLRCDDNETYKETCRKQIREWIKTNVPLPESKKTSNNQEKHDAFEWLIVHVVLPDTTAAQQPRSKKQHSLGTIDSSDSLDTKSKWPGKNSSTIYEKLRADYNSSSKSAIDHVVQVRLPQVTSRQSVSILTPIELEEQWQELIETLKVSILSSFTTRVARYEEDIRERNNQRNLPGWNFCTFFILKEGLARGFENVGLLDDALAGYDELLAGLEDVMRDVTLSPDNDEGTLLPFSKDAKAKIRFALDGLASDSEMAGRDQTAELPKDILNWAESDLFPFSTNSKDYQGIILRNEISASDFHIYIFSRQLEILRRRSNNFLTTMLSKPESSRPPSATATEDNLSALAEIGRRGIGFINTCARMNRHDLYRAWGGQEGLSYDDLRTQALVIDNIVASWMWFAIFQLLVMTNTPALLIMESLSVISGSPSISTNLQAASSTDAEDDRESQSSHESLAHAARASQEMFVLESIIGKTSASLIPLRKKDTVLNLQAPAKLGTTQLAAWRAELCLMAREVMTRLAWNDKRRCKAGDGKSAGGRPIAGIEPWILKRIFSPGHFFNNAYEELTKIACRHFLLARKTKSAEKAVLDLALMKYESSDYSSALTYFEAVKSFYQSGTWPSLTMLVMNAYADCLKRFGRQQEYVQCLLSILTASASNKSMGHASNTKLDTTQNHLDELLSLSPQAEHAIITPFWSIIELAQVDDYIQLFNGKDGFAISLSLKLCLSGHLLFDTACTLVLVAVAGAVPGTITMESEDILDLTRSTTSMLFSSHTTTHGWYKIARLELSAGNLRFLLDPSQQKPDSVARSNCLSRALLVYPRPEALQLKAKTDHFIDLRKPRSLVIELSCRENKIVSANLCIKSATAGLRLRLHEAKMSEGLNSRASSDFDSNQQVLIMKDMEPQSVRTISIPYTIENADTTIDITTEVIYSTAHGVFKYVEKFNINTLLPISVNVQDAFRPSQLFSRFTVSPATMVPLQVESCEMTGAEQYRLCHGMNVLHQLDVFPRQPASFIVSFKQKGDGMRNQKSDTSLQIKYHCIDETVLSTLEEQFLREVESSDIDDLTRLLCSHLIKTYRTKWTEEDLETACLFREVRVWPYEEINWDTILCGLNSTKQEAARTWLRAWHKRNGAIRFNDHHTVPSRSISIPVDIPAPAVVVEVDLHLTGSAEALTLGEPATATLTFAWADAWADVQTRPKNGRLILLSFDLLAPAENWLVGGSKRLNFLARVNEEHEFKILLIPQRVGHLLYPSVEIKCFQHLEIDDHDQDREEREVPCEVAYKGLARSVLVTSGWGTTTVGIGGEDGVGNSACLVSASR